ncbi:DUF2975 domain-containing protein [Roseobacter sinensis]|uniref:DUF2975 domain-containing protein n=1 Tax=Roseobacter sinensis TaxID=2931391 RepID=A0ABT3BHC0_9RHOB|nr:DUF2975 domain-containing protein [Roseobacter sp. WL0113]MCV3272982.1 DUF2975 domain-containing protein [Roseobacter sp. WL0113]
MPNPLDRQAKIAATARAGVWFSTLALGLALLLAAYFLFLSVTDPLQLGRELAKELELEIDGLRLTTASALLASLIWLTTDFMAVAMILLIRRLFSGLRAGTGIFTETTAIRLRRIGWVLVLIIPVSMVVDGIARALLRYWADPTGITFGIGFQDGDIYAVILGLMLVALGHIMVDAAHMAEENRAFV